MFSRFKAFLGLGDTPQVEVQHAERALDTIERLETLRDSGAVSDSVVRATSKALLLPNASSGAGGAHGVNCSIKPKQLRFEAAPEQDGAARQSLQHRDTAVHGTRHTWSPIGVFDDEKSAEIFITQQPAKWNQQKSRTTGDGSKTITFYCASHVTEAGGRCPALLKIHRTGEKVPRWKQHFE